HRLPIFHADKLMCRNKDKSTPADALQALREKNTDIQGGEKNFGDYWDSRYGVVHQHPAISWAERLPMIERMHHAHAAVIRQIEIEERQGPSNLHDLFEMRLARNLRSFPVLRRRMNCSVLFDVEGEPGGKWEVDLRRPSKWFRLGDSGDWSVRVAIPTALLAEVLVDPDGWETLGISYKLDLYFRKGSRAKEAGLARLIHTPSPRLLLGTLLKPRFAEFVVRRRKEFFLSARAKSRAAA